MARTRQNAKRSSGGLAPNVPLATSSSGPMLLATTMVRTRLKAATNTDRRPSEAVKRAKTTTTVQSVRGANEGISVQASGKPFVYHDQSIASLLRQLKDSGNPVYCHKCMDNASQPVPCTRCTNYLCTQCCVQLALVLAGTTSFSCATSVKLLGKVSIPGTTLSRKGVFYIKTKMPFFKQKGKQGLTLTCKGYGPRGVKWLHPKVAVIDARLACLDGEGHPPGMVTQYLRAMMHEMKENVRRFELVIDFPNDNPEEFLDAHQVKIEKLTKEIKDPADSPEVILFFVETHSNDENGDLSYAPFAATDIRNVIIHGHPAEFQSMLPSPHFHVGQQTGIVHLARDVASTYLWSEDHVRPNGVQLPLQCKDCGAVHAWDSGKKKDEAIIFKCTAIWDRELGIMCRGKFISEPSRDPIQNLHTQPLGTWISKPFIF
ncbi:hypothetical protein BXZ70DRAFT_909792 [Cristinia sonorae]|uniref:Uncharacterized protein n=1 Tax=Cristinia sonorae TaxID=1940300 RepID=A0A8K0UHC9_9AGAR|nr:hypothetical protein BXZ70DRAFT_909792 [Cristinia sonorae]